MKLKVAGFFLPVLLVLCAVSYSQSYFSNPESAIYDSERERYFISNVGNGRIIEMRPGVDTSIYYTAYPHVLGMVIVDDILYVTSATKVLGFDLTTDALVKNIPIAGAQDLNDITTDDAGYLYMTGSADVRVYKLRISDNSNSVIASGFYWPNGILFDPINDYLLVCSFGSNAPVRSISLDGSTVTIIETTPFTNLDGLTEDNDGNIYVSSWGSDAIYRYDRDFENAPILISSGHSDPADIYFDRTNNILVVPNFSSNTVDFLDMDFDDDNILNVDDNCPEAYNPGQVDTDDDGYGDACDLCPGYNDDEDADADGYPDNCDNCPDLPGPCCEDADEDGVGDACDNCPNHYNPNQEDINENNIGDVCDYVCGDTDGDELINILDIVYLINYLYKSGPAPGFIEAADVNLDTMVNILDIVYLINNIYKNGPAPYCGQ